MYVNGTQISVYGGNLLYQYVVNAVDVKTEYFKGKNRTTIKKLSTADGLKNISLGIVFYGADRHEAMIRKSVFDNLIYGLSELFLPDGFYYSAVNTSTSTKRFVGGIGVEAEYQFEAIAHDPLITATGTPIVCSSTMPQTDCILSCTVSTSAATYTIMLNDITIVFGNSSYSPAAGDTLVWDGINGRILVNNAPAAHWASFLRLPFLLSGNNYITAPDAVTVQYYPTYL